MKQYKKQYTREEKIAYFESKIANMQKRLDYLKSDDYQEWNGRLEDELLEKKVEELMKRVAAKKTQAG